MITTKKIFLTSAALVGFAFAKAQDDECVRLLQIYAQDAKAQNYDEAFKQLDPLIKSCPTYSAAIYQYGERIYNHRIETNIGDKKANVAGLIAMKKAMMEKFPAKTDIPYEKLQIANLQYEHNIGTQAEIYTTFENLYKSDPASFNDPRAMITYFTLAEAKHKDGSMDLKDLFGLYDELSGKIEKEKTDRSATVETLGDKIEAGTATELEQKEFAAEQQNLDNYALVQGSFDSTLGKLADCDYLLPLYKAEFAANKSNETWLNSAYTRLVAKDCTEDPLYLDLVKALHTINPNGRTAYGLGVIATSAAEREKYFDQAISLGISNDLVYKIQYNRATALRKAGKYGAARAEYLKSVKIRPNGNAYLQIAAMIASSAQSCGSDIFEQRAVYWIAARYAEKAASIDASVRANANQAAASYRAKAPSKSDIFSSKKYNSGGSISVGCWIGESVRIP